MSELIPKVGEASPAQRMFRVNWVGAILRSPAGVPLHRPDFVSRQGRAVRIVDVRDEEELVGPLGYVPGSDWVHASIALDTLSALGRDEPVILVSRGGERASDLAHALERRGLRFVASMMGGIVAWRDLGFATTRDESILGRPGQLRSISVDPPRSGHLTADEVQRHVGDPLSVRWMRLAALMVHGRISCVDGRDDSGVIGTPGGDAGELLLVIAALERTLGRAVDASTIDTLVKRRLDAFGRFYMHTDVHAGNTMIAAMRADRRFDDALVGVSETLEWRRFLTTPPKEVQGLLLEQTVRAEHLGCGHLRLMSQHPERYASRPGLVTDLLRAVYVRRWNGATEAEIAPLAGGHAEGAVLNVCVARGVWAFSDVPLVSPSAFGAQAFINHPQVSAFLRRQLADWIALQTDILPIPDGAADAIAREAEAIAQIQLGATLGALAKGLPIYDVTFHRGDRGGTRVEVEPRGLVT